MEKQEIFNKAWATAQRKEKSLRIVETDTNDKVVVHAYRGTFGARCCLGGIFIPDELYESWMEGESIREVLKRSSALCELYDEKAVDMIRSVQDIHDNEKVEDWNKAFIALAKRHCLKIPTGVMA